MPVSILLVNLAIAGLLFAVGVPLYVQKVPPNRVYGFRTRKTLSDPEVWYPANRVAGRDIMVAAVVMAIGNLVLYRESAGLAKIEIARIQMALLLVPVIGALVHSSLALRKL